jgi:hypothetical protein
MGNVRARSRTWTTRPSSDQIYFNTISPKLIMWNVEISHESFHLRNQNTDTARLLSLLD